MWVRCRTAWPFSTLTASFCCWLTSRRSQTNADDAKQVARNVREIALDYLAVGIDPKKTTICVQSHLPALAQITMLYLNYVTVARLERNPTIKEEIKLRRFERNVPAGFLCYPVSQAADITAFKATVVPVGEEQAPLVEQTNEIVRRVNRQIGRDLLPIAKALIGRIGRLPGPDGKSKMSKSGKNAVPLSATPGEIRSAVRSMFTDPDHLRASDPGKVEGNVVFIYLDAFEPNRDEVEDLKARYRRGGLADSVVKDRLIDILERLIAPIRERRASLASDQAMIGDVIAEGTALARQITDRTFEEVRSAMGLFAASR